MTPLSSCLDAIEQLTQKNATTSICAGLMFSCLDTSIVSTALLSVSAEFQNYQDTPWAVMGYLLTYMSE